MATTRDDFEHWLFEMDDKLSLLMVSLPADVSAKLDYTVGSLTILEKFLLKSYSSVQEILKNSEKDILDQFSRYVGETFRKNLGGIWNIDLKDKKNVYFGIPVIERKGAWSECPVSLATSAIDRRTGEYMERVLKAMLETKE